MNHRKITIYERVIKRSLDFILSLIAIILLSPVFMIVAVLVRSKLGSPVIFKQKRPGLNEKIFTMYKFRSMTDEKNGNGELLPDSVRLTSFGKKLRSTSLDELPEFFNILKGDMSIIGPRPQLVRDMVFMTDTERQRHLIRPGLTGLAQVSGRNNIAWETRLSYDLEYLNSLSLCKDISILFNTVYKVIKKDDVSTEGMDTSEDLGDYLLRVGKIDKKTYEDAQIEAASLLEKSNL